MGYLHLVPISFTNRKSASKAEILHEAGKVENRGDEGEYCLCSYYIAKGGIRILKFGFGVFAIYKNGFYKNRVE